MVRRAVKTKCGFFLTAWLVGLWWIPIAAEEPAIPSPDAVLEQLLAVPPAELASHLQTMKARLAELERESAQLKQQADAKDKEAEAIRNRVAAVEKFLTDLNAVMNPQPPAEPAAQPAAQPAAEPAPAPEPAVEPAPAPAAEPAAAPAEGNQ